LLGSGGERVSALADWLDGRGAIVHEWYRHGSTLEQIVQRLEVDEDGVRMMLRAPALPFPGSSRAIVAELRGRVADLERALLQVEHEPAPAPRALLESDFREITKVDR
jgi:hypothetical protein